MSNFDRQGRRGRRSQSHQLLQIIINAICTQDVVAELVQDPAALTQVVCWSYITPKFVHFCYETIGGHNKDPASGRYNCIYLWKMSDDTSFY